MCALKILLVEDNPSLLRLYTQAFEASGFDVVIAKDGFEALNMVDKENPDLIVLDVMLPKMDGFKVCRILKSDSRSKKTPVLMHTCLMGEKDKLMAERQGADAFIVKTGIADLLAAAHRLVGVESG